MNLFRKLLKKLAKIKTTFKKTKAKYKIFVFLIFIFVKK